MSKVGFEYFRIQRDVYFNLTRDNGSMVEGVLITEEFENGIQGHIEYIEGSDVLTTEEVDVLWQMYDDQISNLELKFTRIGT